MKTGFFQIPGAAKVATTSLGGWVGSCASGVVALVMVMSWGGGSAMGVEQTLAQKKRTPLDAEVEKGLADFLEKGLPVKKEQLTDHMKGVIKEISETVTLTPEETKTLNDAAEKAVAEAVEGWKPRFIEALRPYLAGYSPAKSQGWINGWRLNDAVPNEPVEDWLMPDERPLWLEAVKACLGPERSAVWDKVAGAKYQAREKEIADYLKIWASKSTERLAKDMKDQIEDVKKSLNLPEAQVHAMDDAVETVIKQVSDAEIARATVIFRGMTKATRSNMMGRTAYYVRFDGPTKAQNAAEWAAALKKILSPEQMAQMEKAHAEKAIQLTAEIGKAMKPLRDSVADALMDRLKTEAASIRDGASLSPEHFKLLEAAAKKAVEGFMEEWQKKMIESLSSMSERQRTQVFARQLGIGTNLEGEGDARQIPAWKKALEEILSAEEKERWKQMLATRENASVQTFARIAMAQMDQRVFLTKAQREKLEPVVQNMIKGFLAGRGFRNDMEYNFNPTELLGVLSNSNSETVKSVLDEAQMKHWREAMNDDDSSRRRGFITRLPPKEAPKDAKAVEVKPGARKPEPPTVESIISGHLHQLDEKMEAGHLAAMQLRIEEAARMGGLPAEAVARLTTAAKGSVEAVMVTWRISMDNWVRSQMKDANAQNVRPKLESLGNVSFGNRSSGPEGMPYWKSTVEEIMPADKRKAWQQEQDARREYQDGAVTGAVMQQLQRKCPISVEQEKKLEPFVRKVVAEYNPDIQNWLSEPWYLSSYYCLIPLAGVAEKDLGEALGPVATKRVKESALPQAEQYWESIKQQHDQRIRNGNQGMTISY